MDGVEMARQYYRAIDGDDYGSLSDVLAGGFVHYRPDRTIEGREEFIAFMRSGRPEIDTEHVIEAIYTADDRDRDRVVVEGCLLRADGSEWFRFVDVFRVGKTGFLSLRTYTDG